MQRADQPIQVDDGVFIDGDGIGRAGRHTVAARAEGVELGLIAEHAARGIEQGIEGALQPHPMEPGHHGPFFQGKRYPRGGPFHLMKLQVEMRDELRERHSDLLEQRRRSRWIHLLLYKGL